MKYLEGFAPGWTGFTTDEGFDVLLRNTSGMNRTRLTPAANKNCVGSIVEPGTDEVLKLVAKQAKSGNILLTVGDAKPVELKKHEKVGEDGVIVVWFFAFLNAWPAKAEPVASWDAMFK